MELLSEASHHFGLTGAMLCIQARFDAPFEQTEF